MDGLLEIRPFDDADEPQVVALWNDVFPEPAPRNRPERIIRDKRAVQRELFLVAQNGSGIIGTAMGGYDGRRGWLYAVAVHPDKRRRGVGRALLARVEEELIRRGCPKVNLQIDGANADVVAFYEKLGFAVEDRVSMGKSMPSGDGPTH